MKRILALFLALLMALALCACGGSTSTDGDTVNSEPPTDEIPTQEQATELYLGTSAMLGDLELTITDLYFTDHYVTIGGMSYKPKEGYTNLRVEYSVENKGKSDSYVPEFSLDYNDGFIFYPEKQAQYLPEVNDYVANQDSLPILSGPKLGLFFFEVPTEVQTNTAAPLKLLATKDNAVLTLNYRPMDDGQQEAFYNIAAQRIEEGDYDTAITLLEQIPDYTGAAELLSTANEMFRIINFCGDDDGVAYFTEKLPSYQKVSGEELSNMIVGKWYGLHTTRTWEFFADGTVDDDFDYQKYGGGDFHRTWKIEGDLLTISGLSGNGKEVLYDSYEVYQITEGAYLLTLNGIPDCTMLAR